METNLHTSRPSLVAKMVTRLGLSLFERLEPLEKGAFHAWHDGAINFCIKEPMRGDTEGNVEFGGLSAQPQDHGARINRDGRFLLVLFEEELAFCCPAV